MPSDIVNMNDKELEQIEELHNQDIEASKIGDFDTLRSLFTKDAVILPPGGPVIRGKKQLDEHFGQMDEAYESMTVLDYRMEFSEVKILGDFAFEWGTITGTSLNVQGENEHSSYKVMRILKKTGDGVWKVHCIIWKITRLSRNTLVRAIMTPLSPVYSLDSVLRAREQNTIRFGNWADGTDIENHKQEITL